MTTVEISAGRHIELAEYGDPDGWPVLWCHGGLSSRLDAGVGDEAARAAGVRLVAPNRPGIGGSTADGKASVAEWADTAAALADALGIERFSVAGWSAGGPFALGCAAKLGDRVMRVATVAGMYPVTDPDRLAELGLRVDRLLVRLSRRSAAMASLVVRAGGLTRDRGLARSMVDGAGPLDAAALARQPVAQVAAPTREALRSPTGVADDYRRFGGPWGFDLADVTGPVTVWQGEADTMVPVDHGRRLAAELPGGDLRLVPDSGHFLLWVQARAILEDLRPET